MAGFLRATGVAVSGQLVGFRFHDLSDQQQSGLVDELVEAKTDDLVNIDLRSVYLEGGRVASCRPGKALPLSLTRAERGEEDGGMGDFSW